ncbi:alpha/beta fold hydrolase [Streptacidiphilus sp. P02-A3a]|uniref:alpha/beta fold hydrolase n=1 Tax=Streptacidiphilus sp. P02-A3a TaxID=2704468 RepID=UPI0015F9FA87|nr:alpha/beta hydrolase [Streptacidiphilus sp. P02-A3a]QMU70232.1 alpha/beta hydrolase [Streptacidiphilus sp. P02-A3a]QMU70312.1 alpha/beta hydrolase [Streptacidiphilus sp. P02-A3a]
MSRHTAITAPTEFVEAGGIRFAYRRYGNPERTPVVFVQHFMGNLNDFDPAITDALAGDREVILFNNTGVGTSSGQVPDTIEQMARDASAFIDALGLTRVDLLGHSMGGLVAQEIALARPDLVRKLILVGTGPRGGEEIGSRPAWVGDLFAADYEPPENVWLPTLFEPTETSQAAGRAYVQRITERQEGRDPWPSPQSVGAQLTAIAAYGKVQDPEYTSLKALTLPVLVVNGHNDIIITTVNSYLLQQHLPDAQLVIYPDSGHGAHHQFHDLFVQHVRLFLDRTENGA